MRGKRLDDFHCVLGRAAERYASLHRRRRADAAAGGRAPAGLGPGLEDHAADLRLHQSHAAARSAGEVAAAAVRRRCCRATWRSSTRSTAASSTRCASAIRATRRCFARLSLIDETGERYVRMAHLACVGSHAVNGVAALHTELLKQTVLARLLRLDAREVPQRDQRRDAAALDGAEQSEAERADHRARSATAGSSNLEHELARIEPLPTTRRSRRSGGRSRPTTSARWPASSRSAPASRSIRSRSSTSRSNGCTSTSGSTSTSCTSSPCTTGSGDSRRRRSRRER